MRIPFIRRGVVAALATTALAALGLQVPLAATASAAPPAASSAKSQTSAVRTCGTAKPGQFSCFALRRTDIPAKKGVQPDATIPDGFGPGDLQSAYALPADGGAGETVAIVDAYDDPNAAADLAVYRDQFGLPACTEDSGCFQKVSQRGGTDDLPSPDPGWAGEISLDVDMVSAVAPNAHILLVEADSANFEDLGAAVDEAVALGAKYVSNSYGTGYDSTPGSGEDPSELTSMDPYYDHPGVAVVASSGDGDYGVSYPAASQYVTSVGGTALARDTGASRGWSESVWNNAYGGPGSGCSLYEPKPGFQTDTACDKRAVADVSAVADPETGVSVYQTFGGGGWAVYGGTSASSPIIAGVYASAGTPGTGTYPNAYPYAQSGALNDVTTGNNGTCDPDALCTAGAGWDGPTGLGTPNGLAAFRSGPHGVITGKVTDHATGDPIAGATVKAGDHSATSSADGTYKLDIPPGSYDLTASAYGYANGTVSGVQLDDGATVTEAFALDAVPKQTVSGKVTDGSGHGWPLYAKITATGVPGGPVFTDPTTGAFSLSLPQNSSYTLHVTADYPGYQAVDKTVTVGTSDQTANVSVPVDPASTDAPGYSVSLSGPTEPFTSTTAAPDGWTVSNADGTTGGWTFDDPGNRGNLTGGDGGFAIVDSDHTGQGLNQDSSLVSPSFDLSGDSSPEIGFDTDYKSFSNSTADVDISADGGTTWTTVWEQGSTAANGHVDLPLTDYAGKSDVKVRFHYTGSWAYWWELDNVFVGQRSYDPVTGGLVVGNVTDANTGNGVNGSTLTSTDAPGDHTTTVATPDDPNVGDGFYWLFSHKTGKHALTAAASHYTTATANPTISADGTVNADLSLKAGQLTVTPASVAKTVAWGASATQKVTVKNTGTAPATLTVGETPGGVTVQDKGAPLNLIKGSYSPLSDAAHAAAKGAKPAAGKAGATADAVTAAQGAAGDAWQSVPDLPVATGDNTVDSWQGTVYSAFGFTGVSDTSDLYAYSADSGAWTKLASAADTRESPAHGVIDGKLYAAGGWGPSGSPDSKLEIYDIASNTWTTGAASPKPYAGSGTAVLDGKLYSVGGCTANACGTTDVTAYDPASDSWSTLAAYPESVAWESCGAIAGKLYCSGGTTDAGSISHAYVYDPAADSWSPIADQPTDAWGSSYAAANGLLLVKGGAINNSAALTNQTWAYDPTANSWSALPNANSSLYRGGGSVGFYAVGGLVGSAPDGTAEVLPGYDQTGSSDVTWLSESADTVTVQPGQSATFTATLDASVPEITQPGTYTASLSLGSDTPYRITPIGVSLTVKPPATWGKITGTVTASGGAPLAGATVQIDTWATHYTLKTGTDGSYGLWLDVRNNPLQLIVAKDGYQPTVATVKIKKGATTTSSFVLLKD
ncbi:Kelch motif-containing protein [Actinacidiphila yanglinensis]|uniref:Kelch motif-containing protein n=1 Tax=Actinacidiphila yanglinensis TaxID=310779 RepID=A0A1H6AZ90_9ACTN|nr:carboxypeptidase regulatory-like domain-containing protein [Actinacidiphila yanglinensis]SEG53921.1 Kelch motif-containing protein [Actinacidiphila yanglinensis]